MSNRALELLRKLREERSIKKAQQNHSIDTTNQTKKFGFKTKTIAEKKEVRDPLKFFDEPSHINIKPINLNNFIGIDEEEEEEKKEELKPLKKMPKSYMRVSWPNPKYGELNINLEQILNAKKNILVKTEEEIKEDKRKKEEKKRLKMEKRKNKMNNNENNNSYSSNSENSSSEDSDEILRNKIDKELNINELNINNTLKEEKKENFDLLKYKKISPENMKRLERRLSQARNKYIEIIQKKEKLTLGDEIIRKAKDLEEKLKIPKDLIDEVHQTLKNLKLPSKCIIDEEVSKVIENEINDKPNIQISKEDIFKIMKKIIA